jgi:signal transduction histidine kinase
MLRASMGAIEHHPSSIPGTPPPPERLPPVACRAVWASLGVAAIVAAIGIGTAAVRSHALTVQGFSALALELLPLVALVLLAAGLIGLAAGVAVAAEIRGITATARGSMRRRPRGTAATPQSRIAELCAVGQALVRLDHRFAGEMALYEDALAEVETLDGRRTDLLSAVAGELYGPLDRVVSLSSDLQSGGAGPIDEAKAEDARIVRNAAVRLREMVNEILDLSSLISRDVALELEILDLAEIAREVVETGRGQIGGKKLTLKLDAPKEPVRVAGHRQRLWQIVMNLVTNAIKFTDIGSVVVKVYPHAGGGKLEVVDTGVGIASPDQASVFDTFKQISMKPGRARGAGLGLAICKRLVELHHGRIVVSSIVGQGTRFTVTLPAPKEGAR